MLRSRLFPGLWNLGSECRDCAGYGGGRGATAPPGCSGAGTWRTGGGGARPGSGRVRGAGGRRSRCARCGARSARRRSLGVRHGRTASAEGGVDRARPRQSLEPGLPARWLDAGDREARSSPHHPQRRARSRADQRRARGGGAAAVRPDGDCAAPALCREPVPLLHLQQTGREGHDGHHPRARPLRRQDAQRREGSPGGGTLLGLPRRCSVAARIRSATVCSS